jgi:poly(3-hydroxybutyrate) depolymerase
MSARSEIGRAVAALLAVSAAWFGGWASAAEPLGRFSADPGQVSVSGISSGAFMANQLHIAHSAGIMGAGIIAGGLYGCAVDSVTGAGVFALASLAVGPCMSVPTLLQPVVFYAKLVGDLAAQGWIDPPSNLGRSRVYLFTGQADQVVNSKTVELGASLYRTLGVPQSQMVFRDRDLAPPGAGHSWVTNNFGIACDANAPPFINDCMYDQAEQMLSTIYGPLQPPQRSALSGRIVPFDQAEFVPGKAAEANGMSNTGYLYVPKACEAGAVPPCRLHVALHGCLQSAEVLGDEFYTKVGINEWADTNGIIVLYPQAHATSVSELPSQNFLSLLNTNLEGCWNWWGYGFDPQFLTKQGVQIGAIWSMVLRVLGELN